MFKTLISQHVPKAGGTSLLRQLQKHFGDELEIYISPNLLGEEPDERVDRLGPGKRAVHGHFSARRYENIPNALRFTFLREPIDNLISMYFYWQSVPDHGVPVHSRFLAEKPEIHKFACYPGIGNMMSEKYFGGFDIRKLDFVGFFHNYRSDVERLGGIIDAPLTGSVLENKTAYPTWEREKITSNSFIMKKIKSALYQDVAFYDLMLQRFG